MTKKILQLVAPAVLAFLLASSSSQAVVKLDFTPADPIVQLNQSLTVGLRISGLGLPSFVSAFDVNVFFDPGILLLQDVSVGTALGDPDALDPVTGLPAPEALTTVEITPPSSPSTLSTIHILDLSFLEESRQNCFLCLPPFLADLQQSDTLILATLQFKAVGVGKSPLGLTVNDLVDGNAGPFGQVCIPTQTDPGIFCDALPLSSSTSAGSVTVESSAAVPEPATFLLLGSGLIGLAAWGRRWLLN